MGHFKQVFGHFFKSIILPPRAKKFKSDGGKDSSRGQRGGGGGRGVAGGRGGGGRGGRPLRVFNTQGVGPNFDKGKPNKGPRVVAKRGRGGPGGSRRGRGAGGRGDAPRRT